MSLLSRSVLLGSFIFTGGIISYVHYKQQYDREQIHRGVTRDLESQERRKVQNIYMLQQQQELTKKLKQEPQLIADTG